MEEKLEKMIKRLDKALTKDKNMKKILSTISIFMSFLMAMCSKLMFHLIKDYTGIIKLLLILIGGIFILSSLVFIFIVLDFYTKKKDEKILNIVSIIIYLTFLIFWFGSLIFYDYTLINNWNNSSLKEFLCTLFLYLPGLLMSYTTYRKIKYGYII